jgi:hypothetical protein
MVPINFLHVVQRPPTDQIQIHLFHIFRSTEQNVSEVLYLLAEPDTTHIKALHSLPTFVVGASARTCT